MCSKNKEKKIISRKVEPNNNLKVTYPYIAKEWHPKLNGELKPENFTYGSNVKIWWLCENSHTWEAKINNRTSGKKGCPFCAGKRPYSDNNLEVCFPNIVQEWDFGLNNPLLPSDILPYSEKSVWWKCAKDHKWKARVANRTKLNRGCPYCAGRYATANNNLSTLYPELAKEWNFKKNKHLKPEDVKAGSSKKVWWICKYSHEWQAIINNRSKKGNGCPYCCGKKATENYNLAVLYPNILKEWDYKKNSDISPYEITPFSGKRAWWKCHKGHSWMAVISQRSSRGSQCPYCIRRKASACSGGRKASAEYNLASLFPHLLKEWDINLNKSKPEKFTPGSSQKAWWVCQKGHSWKSVIRSRTKLDAGCPKCAVSQTSKLELRIMCELLVIFPNLEWRKKISGFEIDIYIPDLNLGIEVDNSYTHKKEKDQKKNKFLASRNIRLLRVRDDKFTYDMPDTIAFNGSHATVPLIKEILILIKRNFSKLLHIIEKETLNDYLRRKSFVNKEKYIEFRQNFPNPPEANSLAKYKELTKEWSSKNHPLEPYMMYEYSHERIYWQCEHGHEWMTSIANRTRHNSGCPSCSGRVATSETNLMHTHKEFMQEWHPTRNKDNDPSKLSFGSSKKVWWCCKKGHEWEATINDRAGKRKRGCPFCSGRYATKENNFTITHPQLFSEWCFELNNDLNPFELSYGSTKKAWWECKNGHVWQASLNNRSRGKGCAECYKEGGRSKRGRRCG